MALRLAAMGMWVLGLAPSASAEEGHKTETTVEVTEAPPPAKPTEPAENPVKPGDAAKTPKTPQPADATKPAEPVQEPAKPAGAAKTPETPQPADATKPAEPAKPPVPDPATDAERQFNVKLRDIEERVNALKEKIFQSKARLVQLQEVVLRGGVSGAKALLVHRNEMGDSFRLRRVQYALDGAPIFNRVDSGTGDLNEQEEIEIFNGSLAPGNHQLAVYLEYQGHGYGVFSYLKGYTFKIKSSYTFEAEEGKLTTVTILGYEKGGITTELKDRPSVEYKVERTQALRPESAPATSTPAE